MWVNFSSIYYGIIRNEIQDQIIQLVFDAYAHYSFFKSSGYIGYNVGKNNFHLLRYLFYLFCSELQFCVSPHSVQLARSLYLFFLCETLNAFSYSLCCSCVKFFVIFVNKSRHRTEQIRETQNISLQKKNKSQHVLVDQGISSSTYN